MRRIGKVMAGILAGSLCFVAVAGSLYRSQAQGGQSSSQRENAPAQVGDQGAATPASGGEMRSEEKTVRDAYARLMRYHTAARDEASASLGIVRRADDYMTIGVNNVRTGLMDEIFGRPLSELVTPRGGEVITLKPNYMRGAEGLAHASYGALWGALPEVEKSGKTSGPSVLQVVGETFKGAVKYTSYEVTVSLEGKRRSYRAIALHFNPGRAEGKPETEILDNITSGMNAVLAERSPRVRSPWARYVRSDLHEAIVNSIRAKEQAGALLIPVDAQIGYLPGDEIEAANSLLASAADSCGPPPVSVEITGPSSIKVGEPLVQIATQTDPPGGTLSNWRIVSGDSVCVQLTTDGKIRAFASGTVSIQVDYTASGQTVPSNQFDMTLTAVPQYVVITYTTAADSILGTFFTNTADVTAIKQRLADNLTTLFSNRAGANLIIGAPPSGITSVTTLEVQGNSPGSQGGEAGFDLLNKNRTQTGTVYIGTGSLDLANHGTDPVTTTPINERENKDRVADAIARLAAHEIGHMLGLVPQTVELTGNGLATKLNVAGLGFNGTTTHHNPTNNDVNLMQAVTNITNERSWSITLYDFEGREKTYLDRVLP